MEKKFSIAMLGAGSWGTALSLVLADNNHDVRLWGHRQEAMEKMKETRINQRYLPGAHLPESIVPTSSLKTACTHADVIIFAVPTKAIREVCQKVKGHIGQPMRFVHVSKGIEPDSLCRISEMIHEELGDLVQDLVVLSGPSHAEEVQLRHPTTVTVASSSMVAAEWVQDLFMTRHFRVYTNPDLIGVELGGALKNIIALAAGISDGLGFGDNAKAALITRGLAEIARLGTKMGARPLTFSGLTGIGDLIVTCTSVHSRNWRAGNMLGKGKHLDEVLEQMGMVVEGVRTTKAAYQLSKRYDVNMPITNALYSVLFSGVMAKTAVEQLMARTRTDEMEELAGILDDGDTVR
ncbi:NAD(P)H-dependent glycerol-3-phosphate dehydrogenase [Bacillus fonticola]|uniref:NAD(P)H-dependent glycerol-3-phosphate dehydrogenase n=1 Tax=Bacillus fonticola TaxID=2728853 RepID=UPI001472E2F8|nr:NAD(P)H-dependent glycerol-3-phosphate dehydrogenase [Bacillus fonticola]